MPIPFSQLPEELKELLSSGAVTEKIEQIAEKQHLPYEQYGNFLRITIALLNGTLQPTDYVRTLSAEMDIPSSTAAFLAQEANRDIFNPVKDALKEVHRVPRSSSVTPAVPIPTTPPTSPLTSYFDSAVNKAAAEAVRAPAQPQVPLPVPSVALPPKLEQKLGDTFRMKTAPQTEPRVSIPLQWNELAPTPQVPQKSPTPQTSGSTATAPASSLATAGKQEAAKPQAPQILSVPQKPKTDLYREQTQ